jgi:multiple sugar transport system substrate-binding protein/putative aldouronate transport system substrate-binding protein
LDGLLKVLADMKKAHPQTRTEIPHTRSPYGRMGRRRRHCWVSPMLCSDNWYGEKIKGSVIVKPDTRIHRTDKSASYYKILHFLNDASRMGLVDPDSGTQNGIPHVPKCQPVQVYLMWYQLAGRFLEFTGKTEKRQRVIFVRCEGSALLRGFRYLL